EARTKDGKRYQFGNLTPNYFWGLSAEIDSMGNYLTVEYVGGGGGGHVFGSPHVGGGGGGSGGSSGSPMYMPKTIAYAGHIDLTSGTTDQSPTNTITFNFSTRI